MVAKDLGSSGLPRFIEKRDARPCNKKQSEFHDRPYTPVCARIPGPQQRLLSWHSRTGGTGAHSIRSATTLPLKLRSVYHFNVRWELQ